MRKCETCMWRNEEGVCKNPDAFMEGCIMSDDSWCPKYKRKKAEVQE